MVTGQEQEWGQQEHDDIARVLIETKSMGCYSWGEIVDFSHLLIPFNIYYRQFRLK